MSLQVDIQFGGNLCSKKNVIIKFTILVLSLIRKKKKNILFCHEDGDRERCKLDILILVS